MKFSQYRFRSLLLLTLCFACCSGLLTWIASARRDARRKAGLGIQKDVANWPSVLSKLLESDETLQFGLTPCVLENGFDRISVWRLNNGAPMIDFLISDQKLEKTTALHPRAARLIASIPARWPKQDWAFSTWYATPGFGTRHIEVTDLYLIAIDSETGNAIVLHENHF